MSILMLIQARSAVTARELAEELEVSLRTIHRDIDELSLSGVPVYAERGRAGGFRLHEGYRTRLTGLTPSEAEAVFLAGLKGPAADLGMREAAASAELKLLAALPANLQADAARMRERFHFDPIAWFRRAEHSDLLPDLARAVREGLKIRVRYKTWEEVVTRDLSPLGVVLKAGIWYFVARGTRHIATHRVSSVLDLTVTKERFGRPAKFDLAEYWSAWARRYEESVYKERAVLKVTPRGLALLSQLGPAVEEAARASAGKHGRDGRIKVTIPVERADIAARDLSRLGAECEVLEPSDLRARIREMARGTAALYG